MKHQYWNHFFLFYNIMTKEEQIQEIMECFDFERVRMVMELPIHPDYDDEGNVTTRNPWKVMISRGFVVPTTTELMIMAKKMLKEVADKDENWAIHSGPFLVRNRSNHLSLIFACESWECEYD